MGERRWKSNFIIALLAFLLLSSCAKKDTSVPLHFLSEAYALMDKGENAKAILVLEQLISREPSNPEARVLLASACLGLAGVDVYKAYDSFQDILFNKPIGDNFWGEKEPLGDNFRGKKEPPKQDPDGETPPKAPLEQFVDRLDYFLSKLRQLVTFLNRFPEVERTKWPLLDKALENLNAVEPTKDLSLYRIFLRVVYIKAYLNQEIIRDQSFGTRRWACQLNLESFKDGLIWIGKHIVLASDDFHRVYPSQALHFASVHAVVAGVVEDLDKNSPPGSATFLLALQEKLREVFRCKDIR